MKRPAAITAICIFGYLSVIFTFPQVFSPDVKRLGIFIPALYGIIIATQFMAYVGLWYYKQWGVRLYLLSFMSKAFFFLFTDRVGITFYISCGLFVLFTVLLIRHYPRMNPNL